jgi:hypothetical protein
VKLFIFKLKILFYNRVRKFDKKYFKPFLLREKFTSKDEKLLNTFKKINELSVNKMTEGNEFTLPTKQSRNESVVSIK